ncbi:distal tail protein Dit [Clostridium massiliodielmoense]|uniref:distal tail protein Dit n=1 Tax=Clostridium massiliodielmoense TaxID=1776385 RepID=UPI000A26C1B6|nr:distal tail protein Dit [Clostridium massiliodielmoense]
MYGFEFNNKYSKDLGIYIGKRPPILKAEKVIKHIEVPGRSGTLTEDTGAYKNIELTFECTIKDTDVEEKTILLNNWLDGSGILKLDYLANFFFKVKEVKFEGTDVDYITGDFTVTFVCDPFKYYIDNSTIEIKKPTIIYSPEFTVESEPKVTIFGQGDITLNINNNSIKLKDVQDHITLDSTIQECYKDTQNCNNKMCGEFPLLVEENKINWNGNVSKVEIIPNWRCL